MFPFFIPTFDAWCDRPDNDEPPTSGIGAHLPKPKPLTFPLQGASWTQVGHKLDTSWTQVSPSQAEALRRSGRSPAHLSGLLKSQPLKNQK